MNQVHTLKRAARSGSGSGLYGRKMFAELLALHESMILQLRLECLERVGAGDFLPGMIAQHEKAAALLRGQMAQHDVRMPAELFPVAPGTFHPLPVPGTPAGQPPTLSQ